MWKFLKYPLKAKIKGNFEGLTWKNPPTNTCRIVEFNISMQFLMMIEKKVIAGSQKSRCVIVSTSRQYIPIINWYRNDHITVILAIFFLQYHTLISGYDTLILGYGTLKSGYVFETMKSGYDTLISGYHTLNSGYQVWWITYCLITHQLIKILDLLFQSYT